MSAKHFGNGHHSGIAVIDFMPIGVLTKLPWFPAEGDDLLFLVNWRILAAFLILVAVVGLVVCGSIFGATFGRAPFVVSVFSLSFLAVYLPAEYYSQFTRPNDFPYGNVPSS